ncbi:MAG: phospholipid carrier-dependent glycosyltransferase [Mycobacteriales bacterium]
MTERPADFRFADLRAGIPLVVWLIVALHALVFASYAALVPYYRSPDEIQHVDMAVHLQRSLDYPLPQERQISLGVMNSTVSAGYGGVPTRSPSENRPLDPTRATARSERPSFTELGGDEPYVEGNQMGQHPPVYYVAVAAVLRVVPGSADWPWDRVVHLLRLLSVLMILPVPLLSYVTARRLGASLAVAVTASMVTLAIPEFAHIGSAVNNDNLLVLLMGAAIMLIAYVVTGDSSRRTAVLLGGIGALALLTKGLVLFAPVWIVLVYAAAAWQRADSRFLHRGILAAAITSVLGGWWWIRNLVVYDAIQPRGLVGPPLVGSPAEPYTLPEKGWGWTQVAARSLSSRFWFEHSMTRNCSGPPLRGRCVPNPDAAWISSWAGVASVVTLTLIALALIVAARRRQLLPLLAIGIPFALSFAQLVAVDWLEYAHSGVPSGLQGRYFYLALVGVAVLVALGAGGLAGRHDRWLPLALLTVAALLHARTIVTILGNHWNGARLGVRAAAANATAWSALPSSLVRGTWLGALVLAGAVGVLLLSSARRPHTA